MTRKSLTRFTAFTAIAMASFAATPGAFATPTITSLGSGAQSIVTNEISGTYYMGPAGVGVVGAGRWSMTGAILTPSNYGGLSGNGMTPDGAYMIGTVANNGAISGNVANPTAISPAWSIPAGFTPTALPANGAIAARYNVATSTWQAFPGIPNDAYSQNYGCFGSGDSGMVHTPYGISSTGRFVVGMAYISSYNGTGTALSTSSFRWRAFLWDADANAGAGAIRILPTPFQTGAPTQRRRNTIAYAVSTDGTVIVGAQDHGTSAISSSADPDGSRPVVWRWDGSDYVLSYLPEGVGGNGFPITHSLSIGSMYMNADGTIIVAPAIDATGALVIGKWVWNSGTSSWDFPITIGANLSTPATWLPNSVLGCGIPPTLNVTGITADGNTIVGLANYSTCGSFMRGGWIWHASDNLIKDWYDFQVSEGTPDITTAYGPVEDGDGNPLTGLPKLGNPSGISPDGNAIVGAQGGTQIIAEATPWILLNTGGPSCVAPFTTLHPAATETFSNCDSFILSSRSGGTLPLSYRWHKDGVPIFDGPTGTGSTIVGATTFQLRITTPNPQDAGSYHCEATGLCGTPSVSTASTATAAVAQSPNDLCANAQVIGEGTNLFSWAPCGAYYNEGGPSSCTPDVFAEVWFSYLPTATGTVRIETCGASYDTVLDIFDECNGSILACNDNYITGPATGCPSNRSRISNYDVEINVPVLIRVAVKGTTLFGTPTGNISIIPAPIPAANDDCNFPTVANLGANALDTTEATNDAIVSCNTGIASRDVWFTFTPPVTGLYLAITCPGTAWDTVLSIHDGPCGGELACNNNIPFPAPAGCATSQSRITGFEAFDDSTYYIRVGGGATSAFGPGSLTLVYSPLGDLNCNGTVDGNDISHYVQALLDPAAYALDHDGAPFPQCSSFQADMNQDTFVDMNDVEDFVDLLIGL